MRRLAAIQPQIQGDVVLHFLCLAQGLLLSTWTCTYRCMLKQPSIQPSPRPFELLVWSKSTLSGRRLSVDGIRHITLHGPTGLAL